LTQRCKGGRDAKEEESGEDDYREFIRGIRAISGQQFFVLSSSLIAQVIAF
jgi:hypothetical protein